MCGMCGILSSKPLTIKERDLFRSLCILNVWRGEDGIGMLKLSKNGTHTAVIKSLEAAPAFLYTKKGKDFIYANSVKGLPVKGEEGREYANFNALLGHTRAATKGKILLKNQHPFRFQDIIGFHNGTIKGDFTGSKEYETDSEALIKLIEAVGLEEALNDVNQNYDVAYALQWYNKKEKTLNFLRNLDRPLHFAIIDGSLVWSSLKEDLIYAAKLVKATLTILSVIEHQHKEFIITDSIYNSAKTFHLKPHVHMSVDINAQPVSALKFKKLDVKETYYSSGYGANGSFINNKWVANQGNFFPGTASGAHKPIKRKTALTVINGVTIPEVKKTTPSPSYTGYLDIYGPKKIKSFPWLDDNIEDIDDNGEPIETEFEELIPGYQGVGLTPEEWVELIEEGCQSCFNPINIEDAEETKAIKWFDKDSYICGACYAKNPEFQHYFYYGKDEIC